MQRLNRNVELLGVVAAAVSWLRAGRALRTRTGSMLVWGTLRVAP
jgi:hypothetical protein